MRTVVVIPAGEGACWPAGIEQAHVIAVDGGLDVCRRLGVRPDLWVGDGDSVTDDALVWAHGVPRENHPRDKDASDLELAVVLARSAGDEVVVVGGFGGRLDHLLINAAVLAAQPCRWVGSEARVWFVHPDVTAIDMEPGQVFSLLPWAGPATVTLDGARWNLRGEVLSPLSSRGLSNEAEGPVVLTVTDGIVLLITGP